jgi:hypothetical protein
MKTTKPDDEMHKALEFYADLALRSETVIDTDRGFVDEDGKPTFPDMDGFQAQAMHMLHTHMKSVLEANQVDAQEVMQFFEMCLIAEKVSGEPYNPEHLRVHNITHRNETKEQIASRRQSHLWDCIQECVMATQPDALHTSSDGKAFALDATNSHPLLHMYVQSMQRYDTDMFVSETSEMRPDEVKDFLDEKVADINGESDIDPDSDENDDDPFGMWV